MIQGNGRESREERVKGEVTLGGNRGRDKESIGEERRELWSTGYR